MVSYSNAKNRYGPISRKLQYPATILTGTGISAEWSRSASWSLAGVGALSCPPKNFMTFSIEKGEYIIIRQTTPRKGIFFKQNYKVYHIFKTAFLLFLIDVSQVPYLKEVTMHQMEHPQITAMLTGLRTFFSMDYVQAGLFLTNEGFWNFWKYSPVAQMAATLKGSQEVRSEATEAPLLLAFDRPQVRLIVDQLNVNPHQPMSHGTKFFIFFEFTALPIQPLLMIMISVRPRCIECSVESVSLSKVYRARDFSHG